MKDKNRLIKILSSALLLALFGAVIGYAFNKVVDNIIGNIPIDITVITFIFGLLAVLLTALILIRVETVEEYRYDVTKILGDGFIRIYNDSISEFAIPLVNRSKFIRVVGIARQDVIENKSMKGAQDYLRALENKMAKPCNNAATAYTYLRVLPKCPTQTMTEHINKCSQLAKQKGNLFEHKISENPFYVSFQIFDDTDLLLILDNKGHNNKHDNALCLWTRNKDIINIFIKRFDNGWEEANNKK